MEELDDELLLNTFEVLYKLKVILHDPVSETCILFWISLLFFNIIEFQP